MDDFDDGEEDERAKFTTTNLRFDSGAQRRRNGVEKLSRRKTKVLNIVWANRPMAVVVEQSGSSLGRTTFFGKELDPIVDLSPGHVSPSLEEIDFFVDTSGDDED